MPDNRSEVERLRDLLTAAQMIGVGLSQLLHEAYKDYDEMSAELQRAREDLLKANTELAIERSKLG